MSIDLKYIVAKCEHDHRLEPMDLNDLALRVAKAVLDEVLAKKRVCGEERFPAEQMVREYYSVPAEEIESLKCEIFGKTK